MYTHLAHLYDWPGALDFSDQMLEKTREVLASEGMMPPGPALDLACGTGILSIALASQGWRVVGLDSSEAMLAQAQGKPGAEKVTWRLGDMRDFTLLAPVPLVLCYSDSLNHLLNLDDLSRCFAAIARNLTPGGLLLFDLNTQANFSELWEGRDVSEGPNYRLTITASFDPATGRARAELMAEEYAQTSGENLAEILPAEFLEDEETSDLGEPLTRREDRVEEQYYSDAQVRVLLAQHGFEIRQCEPFNPVTLLIEDETLKTFWVCQKI